MGDPIRKDNPLMAVARGDYFVPQEKEWISDKLWKIAMVTDAVIAGSFLLMVFILSV